MNQIFLGEPSQAIKDWFVKTFPSWPAYTTLEFVDGSTQTKEIIGAATWQNIGVKSDFLYEDNTLKSCQLGNKVTEISDWAFHVCYSLSSITIPNSVTSIADSAFAYCTSLTSINIPSSVNSIGRWAFKGCSSLTSIIFEGKAMSDITSIANYPWSIPNTNAIIAGIS